MRIKIQKISKKQAHRYHAIAYILILTLISVFGLSIFSGNINHSAIGISKASALEPADINSDNIVNIFDLSTLLSSWGNTGVNASDLNGDSVVNIFDLSMLLSKWGPVNTITEVNIALTANPTATASSENTADGQTASKAIDGVAAGYPADYTREWVTVNGHAGSWIQLTWNRTVTVSHVILYDRPNATDQITGGNLTFSDGSTVSVPSLNNDGSATTITFPARSVTSVRLNITSVSGSTGNVGLAEFEAWGYVGTSNNTAPIANAGADQSATTGNVVTLNGSASSDPNSDPLTYAWTKASGPTANLTGATTVNPSFTPTTAGTYVFSLVVNDGALNSPADTVTITVTGNDILPTGYHVNGRYLYDKCGQQVVIRGVENYFWNPWLYPDGSIISEVAKTGANTFRLIPYYPPMAEPTSGTTPLSIAQIENLIVTTINNHMIPDVAIAGGSTQPLLEPAMKAMLMKYQDKILIHAAGEGEQSTENAWVADSINTVTTLRNAGYTAPLYIMSNTFGRNLPTLLNRAPEVLASDPLRNIVFGWQAYWGEPGNYYQNTYGMTLTQAIEHVRDAPFAIQMGLEYETDPWINADTMNYALAMQLSQQYNIGWLWWDWRLGGAVTSLTTDGVYGNWQSPFGAQVAVTHPQSIANTSQRTTFMNTGTCQ